MYKKKNLSIGLLVTSLYDQYVNSIWAGARYQATRMGARLLCFCGDELTNADIAPVSRNSFFSLISSRSIDALLVLTGCVAKSIGTEPLIWFLKRYSDIPVVSIGLEVPGFHSVIVDNEVGMYNQVSHLIEVHGCKRIAFVKGPEIHDEAKQRYNAYVRSLTAHGLSVDPELVCPGNFEIDSGPNAVKLLCNERKVRFDALVCVDDLSALTSFKSLREQGFRVPEDIKVAGFDDIEHSQSSSPPLTTVRQPLFELGKSSVKKVFDIIEGKYSPPLLVFPTHLMARDSCGCSSDAIFKTVIVTGSNVEKQKDASLEILAASILDKMGHTYGFQFSSSETGDLSTALVHLLEIVLAAFKDPSQQKLLADTLHTMIPHYFDKGLTVSIWKGILSNILAELSQQTTQGDILGQLDALWNRCLLVLYQVESYLQSQKRIGLELEVENTQWVGDQLITCFNLDEVKKILTSYLPVLNIQECYICLFEQDRTNARVMYAQNDNYVKTYNEFNAQELIPGGLQNNDDSSYCIMPLESEHEEFGFVIFSVSDLRGQKYDTLGDKIASAFNGARLVETIKHQNIALRKSEEDLRITLNSIGDAVFATDAAGNITRMNPKAEELTGSRALLSLGKPMKEVLKTAGEKHKNVITAFVERILQKGEIGNVSEQVICIAPTGGERRLNYSGAPIRSTEGVIVGAVLVLRDVTEQVVMEEKFRQTQKMEAIGQLAGGVAHDFNNMLAGIMGYAELLTMRLKEDEKLCKFAEVILNSAENAAALTQKLLAFSRKARIQQTAVDVHRCIIDSMQILKHSVDRRITIYNELKADCATITGDPSQIQNAIINLALNARDAMPEGGMLTLATVNVQLDAAFCNATSFHITPGDYIEFSITDTGIGMSKEIQKRIFDPFFTTKEVGKGTGLGLAAVYGIVCDHHGAIQVFSEPGKGTIFKLYLPVDSTAIVVQKDYGDEGIRGSGRILVIDDEVVVRSVLEKQLSEIGYELLLAKDGQEGVELYQKRFAEIDLVILDMVMPRMSGRDAFNQLMQINPCVKILILSGFSRDPNMEELLTRGAVGFVQKPFRRVELSKAIARVIKQT